jgi:hypothetical protein
VTFKDLQKLVHSSQFSNKTIQNKLNYLKDYKINHIGFGSRNSTAKKIPKQNMFAAATI